MVQILRLLQPALLLTLLTCNTNQQSQKESFLNLSENEIKVNQLGFYPNGSKVAVVPASDVTVFRLVAEASKTVVYESQLSASERWPFSNQQVMLARFDEFKEPGNYRVEVDGIHSSPVFAIEAAVHRPLSAASLKALYFNRCSLAIDAAYGGAWARAAGHPDTKVLVHASAASESRPEGSVIAAPGGWYDAGDYNKYVVNSGISTYTLLAAYEHYSDYFQGLDAGIPESGDAIPDVVDEALWNIRWLASMQDPADGGVYHKLTTKTFEQQISPDKANKPRYVVAKSTAATLDFAATLAVASRVLRQWPQYETEAASLLDQAVSAWRWAVANPSQRYQQPDDIITGTYVYDHEDQQDEFLWAGVELFISTGDSIYLESLSLEQGAGGVPSWDYVSPLAWLSLIHQSVSLPQPFAELAQQRVLETADLLLREQQQSAYAVAMGAFPEAFMLGKSGRDFSWGSNGVAANQGMILLGAYHISGNRDYLRAAMANLDYLLGRNALGISFVTGFGSHSPHHPHHRPSEGDQVAEPVPGFLVGGPHSGQQDAKDCPGLYSSQEPALAYIDHLCSYATNEVTINWNAPLVYLSGAIEYYDSHD